MPQKSIQRFLDHISHWSAHESSRICCCHPERKIAICLFSFTGLTAQHTLMFIVSSSLALLFFLNPSCPDQPLRHKVSYPRCPVRSVSCPSHIQNIQTNSLISCYFKHSCQSSRWRSTRLHGWCQSRYCHVCLCLKFDWNTAMADEYFRQPPLLQEDVTEEFPLLVMCSQGRDNQEESCV